MAGLFALLFGGYLVGKNVVGGVKQREIAYHSKEAAKTSGKGIYIDFNNQYHWAENDEEVRVVGSPGSREGYMVVGIHSGTVYTHELSDKEILEAKYQAGLEYCKANGIKYFPWDFRVDGVYCTDFTSSGIEVETGKKYIFLFHKYKDGSREMIYLEDNPHSVWYPRGNTRLEYDAIHNGSFNELRKSGHRALDCTHHSIRADEDYSYGTIVYKVSEEEYKERTTRVEGFDNPYTVEREIPKYGWK